MIPRVICLIVIVLTCSAPWGLRPAVAETPLELQEPSPDSLENVMLKVRNILGSRWKADHKGVPAKASVVNVNRTQGKDKVTVVKSSGNTEFDERTRKFVEDALVDCRPTVEGAGTYSFWVQFDSRLSPPVVTDGLLKSVEPYANYVCSYIQTKWRSKSKEIEKGRRAVLVFRIEKDGKVTRLRVQESSGSEEFDQAALSAVKEIDHFQPSFNTVVDSLDLQIILEARKL